MWANSPWAESYFHLWHTPFSFGFGDTAFLKPLHFWINDGLMAVFCLLVGLEIKREVLVGELASVRQAVLPIAAALINALRASRAKISVFLLSVLTLVCVEGTVMYLIEQDSNPGFRNIPQSIYWAIVTITTVGFGDVAPITVLGKMMASVIMLTGFAIIAVPTGVVAAEMGREMNRPRTDRRRCADCGQEGHDPGALYCRQCGTRLQ